MQNVSDVGMHHGASASNRLIFRLFNRMTMVHPYNARENAYFATLTYIININRLYERMVYGASAQKNLPSRLKEAQWQIFKF